MYDVSYLRSALINAYLMYNCTRLKIPISASKSPERTGYFPRRRKGNDINTFVGYKPALTFRTFSERPETVLELSIAVILPNSLGSFVATCNNFSQPFDVNSHYSTLFHIWQVSKYRHTREMHLNCSFATCLMLTRVSQETVLSQR